MHIPSNVEDLLTYTQNSFIDSETGDTWDFWTPEDILTNLVDRYPNASWIDDNGQIDPEDIYLSVETNADNDLRFFYFGSPIWTLTAEK